jgi:hypothetical protein
VVPEAAFVVQSPVPPFPIVNRATQGIAVQEPEVDQVELVQVAVRVPEYPVIHKGVHVVPLGELETQFPAPAFGITGVAVQAVLLQTPVDVQLAEAHVAEREPAKPELQVGVQVVPEGALSGQSPAPEFGIPGRPLHDVLVHMPVVVQAPELQVAERDPV